MKTRLTTEPLRSRPVERPDSRCSHQLSAPTGTFRSSPSAFRSSSGFTLVELLVVIGILVLLIGILFPVLSRVRAAGQRTKSMAVINNIAQAIEAYHMQFGAYPGPVANGAVISATNPNGLVTSSENLYLGLSGGLYYDNTIPGVAWKTDYFGLGPKALSPAAGNRQYPPFVEGIPTSPLTSGKMIPTGVAPPPPPPGDTAIPEYTDGYETSLPVLYLRANIGNPGIASDDLLTQYDASELYPYTRGLGSGQGLTRLGLATDPLDKNNPNNAYPYLTSTVVGGQPRKVDSFILIGAGPDRIFGTADDITNFGDVMP